jgi:hypothetical protein
MNISSVNGFYIYIARDLYGVSLANLVELHTELAFSEEAWLSFSIEYTEKVTRMINDKNMKHFESSLTWWDSEAYPQNSSKNGIVDLEITTDLKVEHWQEYVEYGYLEWLTALGGILNLCSFGFFQVAYLIALTAGKGSTMGILPELSFTYSNLEMVNLFKEFYDENQFSFDQIYWGDRGDTSKVNLQDVSISLGTTESLTDSLFDENRSEQA